MTIDRDAIAADLLRKAQEAEYLRALVLSDIDGEPEQPKDDTQLLRFEVAAEKDNDRRLLFGFDKNRFGRLKYHVVDDGEPVLQYSEGDTTGKWGGETPHMQWLYSLKDGATYRAYAQTSTDGETWVDVGEPIEFVMPSSKEKNPPVVEITGDVLYVSTKGSDSNSGSERGKALRHISVATKRLSKGTTLLIEAGEYVDDRLEIDTASCVVEGYQREPGDRPSFEGFGNDMTVPDHTVMPVLRATDRQEKQLGCEINGAGVSIASIAVRHHAVGFYNRGDYMKAQYLYAFENGVPYPGDDYYYGTGISIRGQGSHVRDVGALNATGGNIDIGGDDVDIAGVGSFCNDDIVDYWADGSDEYLNSRSRGTDYFFSVSQGVNNFRGDDILLDQSDKMNEFHTGHGLHLRGNGGLITNLTQINMGDGVNFNTRSGGLCRDYIIDGAKLYSRAKSGSSNMGMQFSGDPQNNTVRNVLVEQLPGAVGMYGVGYYNQVGGGPALSRSGGINNTIEDFEFRNLAVNISARWESGKVTEKQIWRRGKVYGSAPLFQSNHIIRDCVLDDVQRMNGQALATKPENVQL